MEGVGTAQRQSNLNYHEWYRTEDLSRLHKKQKGSEWLFRLTSIIFKRIVMRGQKKSLFLSIKGFVFCQGAHGHDDHRVFVKE